VRGFTFKAQVETRSTAALETRALRHSGRFRLLSATAGFNIRGCIVTQNAIVPVIG